MKLTKLQRDALRLARWWLSGPPVEPIPFAFERMDALDLEQRRALHEYDIWDREVYASAILSEVF